MCRTVGCSSSDADPLLSAVAPSLRRSSELAPRPATAASWRRSPRLRALRATKRGYVLDGHAVDGDVLLRIAAAVADPGQPGRADEREAFRGHAGRRVELAPAPRRMRRDSRFPPPVRGGRRSRRSRPPLRRRPARRGVRARARRPARDAARPAAAGLRHRPRRSPPRRSAPLRSAYSQRPVRHDGEESAFPDGLLHSSITRSGNSFVSFRARGKCSASTVPICVDRRDHAVAGATVAHRGDQRRHRLAPAFGRDAAVDRGIGDDLGALLAERQIEQHAGPRRASAARRRCGTASSPGARTRRAWSRPASAPCAAACSANTQRHDQECQRSTSTSATVSSAPRRRRVRPRVGDQRVQPYAQLRHARATPARAASPAPPSAARHRDMRPTARRRS